MRIKEIRDLDVMELKQKERTLVEELFRLRFRHGTGQLDSSSSLKQVRKDIARIKTILREKENIN
ncbi:MAG: 50S ribosomal protein L29 [Syntrophobacterales bacterium]|nr:50S ribosomal protein L29 [Syntrophobacterales bacterium]